MSDELNDYSGISFTEYHPATPDQPVMVGAKHVASGAYAVTEVKPGGSIFKAKARLAKGLQKMARVVDEKEDA